MPDPQRASFHLPVTPAILDEADRVVAELPIAIEERHRLALALSEILTNVLVHAGAAHVLLDAAVTASAVEVVIRDDGDEADLPDPQLPGVDAESGRGLAIAAAVLDECRRERRGDVNVWTLRLDRRPSAD